MREAGGVSMELIVERRAVYCQSLKWDLDSDFSSRVVGDNKTA
jgi:hypothetical protein